MAFRAIWIPTMRCHLQCDYCAYVTAIADRGRHFSYFPQLTAQYLPAFPVEERPPDFWVKTFAALPENATIDTSGGGEPTMYAGLPDVIEALPEHNFALTSNMLGPYERLIKLEGLKGVTASYHYMQPPKILARFWENIDLFMAARGGRALSVTLVAHPSYWPQFRAALDLVRTRVAGINIHWYYAPGFSWANHQDKLLELAGKGYNIVRGLERWRGGEMAAPRNCEAGRFYSCCYGPDGRRFRCLSHLHLNQPQHSDDPYCDTPCLFPCDWDAAKNPTTPRIVHA